MTRHFPVAARAAAVVLALATLLATGLSASAAATVFKCKSRSGGMVMGNSEIVDCDGEQTRTDPNGVTSIVSPAKTPTQLASEKESKRLAEVKAEAEAAEQKALRQLLNRYPDIATHRAARAAALVEPNQRIETAQARLKTLASQRVSLKQQAEFFPGGPPPGTLKQSIEQNDASVAATELSIRIAQDDIVTINTKFDTELARLQTLWPKPRR